MDNFKDLTMGARLKYFRKELLHLSAEKFGEAIDLSKSSVINIENGNREITDRTVKSICREYGACEEWLRYGTGEPLVAQTRNQKILAFANKVMADEDDAFRKRLVDALSELDESGWEVLEKIALHFTEKND
jgi:transcriptional regulator with XRE-family HTH domain